HYLSSSYFSLLSSLFSSFFFFTNTAPSVIYTLSLHDALPIYVLLSIVFIARYVEQASAGSGLQPAHFGALERGRPSLHLAPAEVDRKSTRLNSSHVSISYAVFCLKKKKKNY